LANNPPEVKEFTNFNSVFKINFCLLINLACDSADDFQNLNAYFKFESS